MVRHKCFGVLWSDAEKETLRKAFASGGLAAARRKLPHRSRAAVARQSYVLGLTTWKRLWTVGERQRLESMWGICTIGEIAASLRRPRKALVREARKLGLQTGAPPGWESITAAAARAGYAIATMHNILAWSKVDTMQAYVSRSRSNRIVDPEDVDEAVLAWMASEPFEVSVYRTGIGRRHLLEAFARCKITPRPVSDMPKSTRRVPIADVDRAVKDHYEWRRMHKGMKEISASIGVSVKVLRGWLKRYGVVKANRTERLDVREVDRIIEAEMGASRLKELAA